jgi:hypothetical protein
MGSFDTDNVDPSLERVRMAYHEAGHAVVAWSLGIPVVQLSITARPGHGELARGLAAIHETRGEAAMHAAGAMFFLAGQCAQMEWDPYCFSYGCEPDRAAARFHADNSASDLKTFEQQTAELIRSNWQRISTLAVVLLERNSISGSEVARILERTTADLRAGAESVHRT